ncbi:MAG: chemotaxis protein CheW [Proteobacteria bacterium]|nr:chemotaxis protein CheW [Pseudomonadota bacterium]
MWDDRKQRDIQASEGDTLQVARFSVGEQEYALDIMRIKEIINPVPITRVPNAPTFIEGMIELRGAFLAVIDLRKRFGLEPAPLARDRKYIVVTTKGQNFGLIVDRVIDVHRIAMGNVRPVPDAVIGPQSRFVKGVIKSDERIAIAIDLDAVLSPDERDQLLQLEL